MDEDDIEFENEQMERDEAAQNYEEDLEQWNERLEDNLAPIRGKVLDAMIESIQESRSAMRRLKELVGPLVDVICAAEGEEVQVSDEIYEGLSEAVCALAYEEFSEETLRSRADDWLGEILAGLSGANVFAK